MDLLNKIHTHSIKNITSKNYGFLANCSLSAAVWQGSKRSRKSKKINNNSPQSNKLQYMDTFSTKSTSLYSQKVNEPLIIEEGETTRRVFFADTNDKKLENGETVSGIIVHQRKKKNDDWEDVDSINLTSLKGGEGVKIKFDSSQLKKFYDGLSKIYALANQGVNWGANEYIVGKTDEIISVPKNRKQQIESLLEENLGEDIWEELIKSNPDLATKLSLAKIQNDRKIVLEEFKNSLIDEEKKEEFWQSFFTKNDWIFGYGLQYKFLKTDTDQPNYGGEDYKGKGKQKGDFLTHTEAKNAKFTVLVEIKKPHTDLLAKKPKTGERVRYRNGVKIPDHTDPSYWKILTPSYWRNLTPCTGPN